jgi:Clostridium P-47 protein
MAPAAAQAAGTAGLTLDYPIRIRLPELKAPAAAARRLPAVARIADASAGAAGPAETYGWDTVFAIHIDDVNSELRKPGVCPAAFCSTQDGIDISGMFGPWQVCLGGGAENIHFAVPILTGQLTFQGNTASMNGATATIELKLQYVPQQTTSSGGPNNLVVKTTPDTPEGPVVSVLDLSFSGPDPGTMAKSLMIGGLTDWFNANLQLFTHIFASVDLNDQLDQGQYQWLAPTYTGYAYVDGATTQDAMLGVLSMTQSHSAANLVAQLSPYAIPSGARSGFTISQSNFLSQMILPSLPGAFPGAQASDFALSSDGSAVVNVNTVNTQSVEHDGITYQPVVQSLSVTVSGQEIQISVNTQMEISPGINVNVTNMTYLALQLDVSSGSPKLTWVQTRDPVSEQSTDLSPGVQIGAAVLALIALLITAILSVLTDGAFFIIASIIVGLVIGLASATPEMIAAIAGGAVGSEVPSITALVLNATSTIQWSGSGAFQVTSAGLNGSFQLGGDPCFAD